MTRLQRAIRICSILKGAGTLNATCGFLAGYLDTLGHPGAAALLVRMGGELSALLAAPVVEAYGDRGYRVTEVALAHYGSRVWQRLQDAARTSRSQGPRTAQHAVDDLAVLVIATQVARQVATKIGRRYARLRRPLLALREYFVGLAFAGIFSQPHAERMVAEMIDGMETAGEKAVSVLWRPVDRAVDMASQGLEGAGREP